MQVGVLRPRTLLFSTFSIVYPVLWRREEVNQGVLMQVLKLLEIKTYNKLGIEELASGMIIRAVCVETYSLLLSGAPCVLLIKVDKSEVPIDSLPSVGRIRHDSMHGHLTSPPH